MAASQPDSAIFGKASSPVAGAAPLPPPAAPPGRPPLSLKTAQEAAAEALAGARRDAEALHGTARGSSGRPRRRSRTPPTRSHRPRASSPVRPTRDGGTGPRVDAPRHAPPKGSNVYLEYYRASLRASTDEAHVGLLAQFFASTSQGKDRPEEVLGQIASRVRTWGVSLHDLYIFTDEEIKGYLSSDPVEGDGPSLSRALSHRGVVTEAVTLARALHAEFAPTADVGDFVGRLAKSRPRDGSSPSSARSRSRRRSTATQGSPGASGAHDPALMMIAKSLERLEGSDKKTHHLDANPDKIHFDVTGVRLRPLGGDHSAIDPLSFPDHESISKLKQTLDAYRTWTTLPFLHARVESFQPRWLGGRLSAAQREAFVKLRLKKESTSVAQLCNASLSFWLAHMAVGVVSFQQVACHIFLLLRISEDYNPDYAILYHDRLLAGIRQRISMGEDFDIGGSICRLDNDVLREVDHKRSSSNWEPPPRDRDRRERDKASGKGARGKGDKDKGDKGKGDKDKGGVAPRTKSICFAHDPSSKKVCKAEGCHREHLDTNLPENKARYLKAHAAFEDSKKQRQKAAASV